MTRREAPTILTSTQGKGAQRAERWDGRSRLVPRCLPMSHFPHLLNECPLPFSQMGTEPGVLEL